jgi:FecR protein
MKHLRLGVAAVALALIPAISHAFEAGFARISMIDGEALVRTEESSEWLPAAVNTPLYEGDSIWSPEGGRVEIQLQNGSYLRLNDSTSIDVVVLDKDFQQVHLGMGHVYVRTGRIGANGLQIDVNDTSLKVYDKARFRVDLAEDGDEEIALFKGDAYVEGNDGRTRLRTGELLAVEGSRSELAPLNPPDEWERWNRDRDRRLAERKNGGRYLPEELAVYSNDLDANGEWIDVPEYGHVWRPTVIFSAEWSPYREGRWVWRGDDYIWVSTESWGWAPYHYGRWVVLPDQGWCWVPPGRSDVFWAPGYVGWVTTPTHVGWVPLAPGEIYYGRGNYGRHSVNLTNVNVTRTSVTNVNVIVYKNVTANNAVTVVRKDAFAAGRVEPVRVRENIFVQKNVVIGRPAVRPVAREALMPAVKAVSPAKLPPASLASVPVRELRERHPQLMDRPATPPLRGETIRRGPEQARPEKGRGIDNRPKPVEKAGAAQPASGGAFRENGRPAPPQRPAALPAVREAEQRDKSGSPAVQRPAPQPRGEARPGTRTDQAKLTGGQRGEAKLKPQGEEKAKKIWKVKEKDAENENKEKPKTKID